MDDVGVEDDWTVGAGVDAAVEEDWTIGAGADEAVEEPKRGIT